MSIRTARRVLLCTTLALASPTMVFAQEGGADTAAQDDTIQSANEIVVIGSIGYRNREEDLAEPVLVYDTDYFQRFEPLTAGDALKRVPSVTFLSDVIESDGARLRGLAPGYTQIQINGEKVPGSNADRSFFLDRIPAELVERVEIVRSSSARRTGDAVAGTLNIKLRDAYQIDGGYLRAGGLYFDDKEFEPSLGAVFGTEVGPGRLLVGANFQGRHNPKKKFSLRYSDSPENSATFATTNLVNREDQVDTRDGKDYSLNLSYIINGADTDVALNAFYVRTDRLEDERSFEYNSTTAINGPVRHTIPGNLLSDNANVVDIAQDSYSVSGKIDHKWALGKTSFRIGYASFEGTEYETEYEIDFNRSTPRFTGDLTLVDIRDRELTAKLDHEFEVSDAVNVVIGGYFQDKDRFTQIGEDRNRFNLTSDVRNWNQFVGNPTTFATPFDPAVAPPGGNNQIDERRIDGFALIEGNMGALQWEAGVRYETTEVTINDFTVPAAQQLTSNDYAEWLPSASFKLDIGSNGRLTASAARTLRRPEFNFISPALLEAELGDNDLLGNPLLNPETAWGGDLGYEHRIGKSGIIGVNLFYRDVSNLIETVNTQVVGSEGPGTFVLQPRNVGDGKVWGVEFDLSASLGFVGLPDTGIFGNFSWLDSEISDFMGTRRFNGQSKYVYNFGMIQDVKSWGAAFGATYRKQGRAFDRIVGEEIFTSYGADLEIFVEKRIGKSFTIRAVGSNLLDGSKDEVFNKFDTIGDQTSRDFAEYELETESAGPVFQVIARFAF